MAKPREIHFVLKRGVLDHGAETHKRSTRVQFWRVRHINNWELHEDG